MQSGAGPLFTYRYSVLEHDPEKHALGLDPWVDFRFSE
jgi:hypothetical protein